MNLKPLHDNIIVQPDAAPEQTSGGIILNPDTAERPNFGVIVAAGPGRTLANGMFQPIELRIGDRIMFGKFDGKAVPFDGKVYLQLAESDVMAVVG